MKSKTQLVVLILGSLNFGLSGYFVFESDRELAAAPTPIAPSEQPSPTDEGHDRGPASEHGAAKAETSPVPSEGSKARTWIALDDMFANVLAVQGDVHTLIFKVEIELFEEGNRRILDQRQPVILNAILQVAREQPYDSLQTLAGKLYFKEALVASINQSIKFPLVRDVHLASFALR